MNKADFSVWRQALAGMPRLEQSQWQQLDLFGRWLVAVRASVLLMTFTSAALGGLLARRADAFDGGLWVLVALGLVLAHATNNLVNDWTDSATGIDKDNYFRNRYGTHVLEQGLLSRPQLLAYIIITGGIALFIGGWLVAERGGITLGLLAAGCILVLFYTWPLKHIGMGEPAVLLAWGPLMVGGCYFVVSGHWDWQVALAGTVYALGPTSVLFGKHIDKLEADTAKGVRTLPVLLGQARARRWVIGLLMVQYALLLGLIVVGYFSWYLLLVMATLKSLPAFIGVYRQPRPDQKPDDFPASVWPLWYSAFAFDHTRKFSGLLLLALLLDLVLVG
jgi:1,4-dihydroxy-2-naphthoate octaprenyltransferase